MLGEYYITDLLPNSARSQCVKINMNFKMLPFKSVKNNFPYFAMKDLGMHDKSEISAKHV